jgi:regulator of cell morphogenesis and NO signaling
MNSPQVDPTRAGFADRTLADIATTLPGATAVFRSAKLDYCCGGGAVLRNAAAARQSDLGQLVAKLEALAATAAPTAAPQDVEALIAAIETRFHQTHRRELPELIRLARRVEAVHRDVPSVPAGLANLLDRIQMELESHMQKEEQVLFPLMRQGGHPGIGMPIRMMRGEHDDHGAHLRALEALTNDFTPPPEACTTWRALYAGTRKFANDLVDHIHTENNTLFPRFDV